MKTAVSIPDDLFARAEELAARLGKSRSQVYREALTEYLSRRDPLSVTAALDELAAELDLRPEPLVGRGGSPGTRPRRVVVGQGDILWAAFAARTRSGHGRACS